MKELTKRNLYWLNCGREYAAKGYSDNSELYHSMDWDELEAYVNSSFESQECFHAGLIGREPEYVEAIRFGEIPECGQSTNWAEGTLENGVSCVKIIRSLEDLETKSIYDATCGWLGAKKYLVGGWYIGRTGSDGEPLLFHAEIIREI